MIELGQNLGELDVKSLEIAKKKLPKHSIKRQLFSNLLTKLNERGNVMIDSDSFYIKKCRVSLSAGINAPTNTPFIMHIWVKPFVRDDKYLMLSILEPKILKGHVIKASDIFGRKINDV